MLDTGPYAFSSSGSVQATVRTTIWSLYSHFLRGEQEMFLPFPHFSLLYPAKLK
jgi:hypothetical protein